MYKANVTMVFVFVFFFIGLQAQTSSSSSMSSQTDSFYTIIKNKAWTVDKLISDDQSDKKSFFSNVAFTFNQLDTNRFLIEKSGRNNMTGRITKQDNNKIIFSIPLIKLDSASNNSDSLYNEGVKLLCAWSMQKVEIHSDILTFKIMNPMKGFLVVFKRRN